MEDCKPHDYRQVIDQQVSTFTSSDKTSGGNVNTIIYGITLYCSKCGTYIHLEEREG